MKTDRRISAILIVLNEEKNLRRSLLSLAWCDEIIIVDGQSTDRSKQIALDPETAWSDRIRWFERAWDGFKNQRNFALDQASHLWILALDADEECTAELRAKIQAILNEETPHRYWKVHRQEYFLGKPIHFGVWNPSYQDRFFHREGVRFVNEIHEYAKFPGESRKIHESILHSPDFNPDKFLEKLNKYTTIEARDRVRSGRRTNLFHVIFAGPAMFIKNYFYYRAYRDGAHGVAISVLEGISRSVRHVKMWWMQNERPL